MNSLIGILIRIHLICRLKDKCHHYHICFLGFLFMFLNKIFNVFFYITAIKYITMHLVFSVLSLNEIFKLNVSYNHYCIEIILMFIC